MSPGGVAWRGAAALAAFALLTGLGFWQLERKSWKEALIARLEARAVAAPVALPSPGAWARLDPAADEFRRVRLKARFGAEAPALVYTGGSAFREHVAGPGYWVLAPVTTADGGRVVVNRGFVPHARTDAARNTPSGEVELVGALRWPELRGTFTPADDPARGTFFVRDPTAIARAQSWGAVAPFLVELEAPQPPGGLPRAERLSPHLRNEHLQYAITWFGLAGALAVIFGLWVVRARRG